MKCCIVMFLTFRPFYSECNFLCFQNFISPSIKYLINSSLSVVVCIYKIHVIEQDFYPLSNHIFDNWKKCLFPISVGTFVAETNSLIKLMQPTSQNYLWENGFKKIKATEEKLSQGRTLCPNAKKKDPNRRIKMHQLFLKIFTTICLIPAE